MQGNAVPLKKVDPLIQGAGQLNLRDIRSMAAPNVVQAFTPSNGQGSLEAARGAYHVSLDGVNPLVGEVTAFGSPWVMTADSSATTGLPFSRACSISGEMLNKATWRSYVGIFIGLRA